MTQEIEIEIAVPEALATEGAQTRWGFWAPRGAIEQKPAHGAACNRCGLCCYAERCPVAIAVLGDAPGPCPALEGEFKNASCGLVTNPAKYAPALAALHGAATLSAAAAFLIGSGRGCDARFNGEPETPGYREGEDRAAKLLWRSSINARAAWGIL